MRKLIFNCPDKLHDELAMEREKTGVPVAEIIRRALVNYLNKEAKK